MKHLYLNFALLGSVAFSACGGTTTPTTPPVPSNIIRFQGAGSVPGVNASGNAGYVNPISFSVDRPSRVDLFLTWTLATNNIDAAVFANPCTSDMYVTGRCTSIGGTGDSKNMPDRFSILVLPQGTYALGIINRGLVPDSFSYELAVTP